YAEGTDRVRISASVQSGRLEISVRDWGTGIPVEDRKRIFERFHRGRDAQKSHQRGSGIGLTLVRSIVDSHGGRIRLEIPPKDGGRGTEFVISLPV
ncbi:MAG: sensor histidine kinase, partial [Deltaproteobacteria bacterium]|nr:sensor histidine kinase [Deltaproteobacteria bacterium]